MKTRKVFMLMIFMFCVVGVASALAQNGISVDALYSKAQGQGASIKNLANWVLGVILLIGVIVVGYKLTSGKPEAREGLIGWIGGIVFIGIAMALINLG